MLRSISTHMERWKKFTNIKPESWNDTIYQQTITEKIIMTAKDAAQMIRLTLSTGKEFVAIAVMLKQ